MMLCIYSLLMLSTLYGTTSTACRIVAFFQDKRSRQDERRRLAEALGDKAPPKMVPKTIDAMRESDVTTVEPKEGEEYDEEDEVAWDIENDEFKDYFAKTYVPKVLITSAENPRSVRVSDADPRISAFYLSTTFFATCSAPSPSSRSSPASSPTLSPCGESAPRSKRPCGRLWRGALPIWSSSTRTTGFPTGCSSRTYLTDPPPTLGSATQRSPKRSRYGIDNSKQAVGYFIT